MEQVIGENGKEKIKEVKTGYFTLVMWKVEGTKRKKRKF